MRAPLVSRKSFRNWPGPWLRETGRNGGGREALGRLRGEGINFFVQPYEEMPAEQYDLFVVGGYISMEFAHLAAGVECAKGRGKVKTNEHL